MKTTADFLDDLRAKLGLPSDGKLSLHMGWASSQLSRYRTKKEVFGDYTAVRVAEQLGIEPGYVMACMKAQLAKTPKMRSIWEGVAQKVAAALFLGIGLGIGTPDPAEAGMLQNAIIGGSRTVYTLCVKRARRLARWLLAAFAGLSLTLTLAAPAQAQSASEPFLQQSDKQQHIVASAAITFTSSLFLYQTAHPVLYGALVGLAAGVGKELHDRNQPGNHFDAGDIKADMIGVAIGAGAGQLIFTPRSLTYYRQF